MSGDEVSSDSRSPDGSQLRQASEAWASMALVAAAPAASPGYDVWAASRSCCSVIFLAFAARGAQSPSNRHPTVTVANRRARACDMLVLRMGRSLYTRPARRASFDGPLPACYPHL